MLLAIWHDEKCHGNHQILEQTVYRHVAALQRQRGATSLTLHANFQ